MILKISEETRQMLRGLTPQDIVKRFGLEKGGRVQMAIDKAVIDWCQQYTPWDTGTLSKSAYGATIIGSGVVRYPGPYAHYQYYGEVYGPNIPIFEDESGVPTRFVSPKGKKKSPTGKNLQYQKTVNALAGPFWFERMKADHKKDIIQEAENVARNK